MQSAMRSSIAAAVLTLDTTTLGACGFAPTYREDGTETNDGGAYTFSVGDKVNLLEIDTDKPVSGTVDVAHLSSLDRDLLKDTLGVVKRFRTLLRQRFRLDVVS